MFRQLGRRFGSTSATTAAAQTSLSDAELRLLISLHHQARNFITLDNLDHAIVEAFVPSNPDLDVNPIRTGYEKLRTDLINAQRQTSQYSRTLYDTTKNKSAARDTRVHGALYGTESSSGQSGLPGLETVREEIAEMATALKRETRTSKSNVSATNQNNDY